MAYISALKPLDHNRIDHFDEEDLCMIHNLCIPLEQGSHPNTRRVPNTEKYNTLHTKTRTEVLGIILKDNPFLPDRGRKFLWPEAKVGALQQRAKALGYTALRRGAPMLTYFSFGLDDYALNKALPLLINPTGEDGAVRQVPVMCAAISFVKIDTAVPVCGFILDTALMQIDMMWSTDEDFAGNVPEPVNHIKARLADIATGSGKSSKTINKGLQLARAAKQYNAWCKTLYGEESLTVRVFNSKVEVTRIAAHRPLPHWTRLSWGVQRPRVSAYILEAAQTIGGAVLSPKQLTQLRGLMSQTKLSVSMKCEVDKHSALYISDGTVKVRTTPHEGDVLLEKVTYIKLTPK